MFLNFLYAASICRLSGTVNITIRAGGARSAAATSKSLASSFMDSNVPVAKRHVLDRGRQLVSFEPGSVFAFVRWASNDFGTIVSRIDILCAVRECERYSTVPCVRPGGEILLRLAGWRKVESVLQAIDIVEALGIDPPTPRPSIGAMFTAPCSQPSARE